MVRFMLAMCGEEYEEVVPGLDGVKWLSEKEHIDFLREHGFLMFNQVPLLRIDGMNLVQSHAIVRYLARKHHLYGDNEREAVYIDMIAECVRDLKMSFSANNMDKFLGMLERHLAKNEGGFLAGSKMSYPDITVMECLEMLTETNAARLDSYPCLKAHWLMMREQPRMKEFLETKHKPANTRNPGDPYWEAVKRTIPEIFTAN